MKFTEQKIVTGVMQKVSKTSGKPYVMINYLNDDGQTFGTIAECTIPVGLKQLDKVLVDFELTVGKYMQLKTIALELV